MRQRSDIKAQARANFSACYWPCVLVAILVPIFMAACASITAGLASILFSGPLAVGMNYFYVHVFQGKGDRVNVGTPFSQAFTNYGRKLGGYWWMQLFIGLWSLLFVIPGIIKTYSYAMTMYILADCPNVRAKDALKLSMRIMDGHKWELFVFQLSFIGWSLLSSLTAGLLGIFYAVPYYQTAMAGYYLEVRENALRQGIVTLAQLEGLSAV